MTIRHCADMTFKAVSECVDDVARWFLENGLLLNTAKTETVLFGTKAECEKIPVASGIDEAVIKGKVTVIYRNFEYVKECDNHCGTTSWRCPKYQCMQCKARLITSGNRIVSNRQPEHTHSDNVATYGPAVFPVASWNQHAAGSDGIARSTNSVEGWQ